MAGGAPPARAAAAQPAGGGGGGFGAAARARKAPAAGGGDGLAVESGSDRGAPKPPLSSAQAYAEKKRLAMEKAERIKAERKKALEVGWVGTGAAAEDDGMAHGGMFDMGGPGGGMMGGPGGMGGAPPPMGGSAQAAQNELDMLHAMGDRKFGGPRRR